MDVEDRLAVLEREQAALRARQAIWETITRYARGIDEQRSEDLEAIFTEDTVFQTLPWSRPLQGKAIVLKAFRNYRNHFQNPRRFITNEQLNVHRETFATGWANWFVVQGRDGESYYGWGTYDWEFRFEEEVWKISKMIITVECMTTLERGWGELEERVVAFPSRPGHS